MRIWVRPLSALVAQALPGTEGAKRPFWSPDSRFLAFISGGKLKKINISGGPPSVICDAPTGSDGTWGKSDVILFDGSGPDPLMRVSATGGVATAEVKPDTVKGVQQVGWPEFLPDGKHFLYLTILPSPTLHVAALGSGKGKALGPCESQVQYIEPGYLLYSRGGSLVLQPFDARALKLKGEPVPIAEQVGTSVVGGSDFRASNNGVLVYSTRAAQVGELAELDRAGRLTRLLDCPPSALSPMLSPDDRRATVRAIDPQTRSRNVWILDRDRGISTRFTFEPSNENYPYWSPDGKRIAYWSDAPGASGVVAKQLTGSGETELLAPLADEVALKDWSADGSTIFLDTFGATGSDIATLAVSGDKKVKPFLNGAFNEFSGRLSPDGRYLAYVSDESGRDEIYVQTYPDRSEKWQISARGGDDPHWANGGRELLYLSPEQQMMSVPITLAPPFAPGTPAVLFQTKILGPGQQRNHYAVTRDGGTFILFRPLAERTLPTTTVVLNWMSEIGKK